MDPVVVFTTGRTGSTLICQNLAKHTDEPMTQERDRVHSRIVHSHDPFWTAPTNNYMCVLSKRRDVFAQILSMIISKRTNEFTDYTKKSIELFAVEETEFESSYWFIKCFYQTVDVRQFKKTIEIYYEDLVSDPDYLFRKFDISKLTNYGVTKKSPYWSHDMILNMRELKTLFKHLEHQELTDELLSGFKESIKTDLEQVYKTHRAESLP
jgi:hypothetical protein